MNDILIRGVPFWALGHHDGRFVRAPGLFAFARRQSFGRYEVLHLEVAEAINQSANPGHDRWSWALSRGMDSLLVHFGARMPLPADAQPDMDTVDWAPEAEVRTHGFEEIGAMLVGPAPDDREKAAQSAPSGDRTILRREGSS